MTLTPKPGDVIVEKREAGGPLHYDVKLCGEPSQYSVRTYERALNRADSFARHDHVDVWYSEDGAHYRLVTSRRLRRRA